MPCSPGAVSKSYIKRPLPSPAMASRRERRQRRLAKKNASAPVQAAAAPAPEEPKRAVAKDALRHRIYRDKYRILLFIPFILLVAALLQIGLQTAQTGDFLIKGVSLKGGITLTIPEAPAGVTATGLQTDLHKAFPNEDILVQGISELGQLKGYTIQVAAGGDAQMQDLENRIMAQVDTIIPGAKGDYSVEIVGPSLGASFFRQTLKAVVIAFLLMGMVIFLYFGENLRAKLAAVALTIIASIIVFQASGLAAILVALVLGLALVFLYIRFSPPSAAVILAAFSDIVVTLAVVNVLGVKLSSAGIAAFLMLIGYSVDTDILLSTRVLKRTKGTIYERIVSSLKTGLTMSITSFVAALAGFLVTQSETIRQIMLIILIGLLADMINTWLQNTGIIRLYAERRARR